MSTAICREDDRRWRLFGQSAVVGLDYLDVSATQTELTVYFIGRAPASLTDDNCAGHFSVEGGRRIRDIEVTDCEVIRSEDPDLDDKVRLRLDKAGDFSTYRLRIAGIQETIDPLYDHIDFSFKVDCPSDLDCLPRQSCPPERREAPEISYLARDYESLRQLVYDRLAVVMPDWQERHAPDLGVTLVELLACTGDYLSYHQDAVATEAYLETARRRISVRRHARLVDYFLHDGCNSRTWVAIEVGEAEEPVTLDPADVQLVTSLDALAPRIGALLSRRELDRLPVDGYLVFEPLTADRSAPLEFWSAHNRIGLYAWGQRECCLPEGTTAATLLDQAPGAARGRVLHLAPGDVLILEEVLGPETGSPSDADPAHRHPVRLISAETAADPLDGTLVLEIRWAKEDALPFALCLSAVTDPAHGCTFIDDVSVARGNLVLADQGASGDGPEVLEPVPTLRSEADCPCPGHPGDVNESPGLYRPRLGAGPLTYSERPLLDGPAAVALSQDPRRALPNLRLNAEPGGLLWEARRDLLGSQEDDRHFVVEIDNEGRANLRFGDGECGLHPPAGSGVVALYRTGNGRAGNVGAESIRHLVYRTQRPGGIAGLRNPLPASGGTDPEPIAEAKLLAPAAFRKDLQRAVVPADYAAVATRNPAVQRAAAVLRWSGSWYEVRVAVDPLGSQSLSDELAAEIEEDLRRYRRIGHDLRIVPACYAPLHIAMEVCVDPDYLRGHVQEALERVFGTGTLADGGPAFFHPDRLSFGEGVYLSPLIAAAQAVEGVESARVTRLQRLFEQPDHELANGVLPLGPLEVARCDNDPSFPEHGRFELSMLGGR
ncbi:MAG: putative baseplate assembly protein [Chromatiales bacterium]|jgi:hypothetical protein